MRSLEQVLEDGVGTTGKVAGVAAAYATRDGMQFLGAAGSRCLAKSDPMQPDALFRIASMTKAITSIAALQFVDSGDVGLDDEISRFITAAYDAASKLIGANREALEGIAVALLEHEVLDGEEIYDIIGENSDVDVDSIRRKKQRAEEEVSESV